MSGFPKTANDREREAEIPRNVEIARKGRDIAYMVRVSSFGNGAVLVRVECPFCGKEHDHSCLPGGSLYSRTPNCNGWKRYDLEFHPKLSAAAQVSMYELLFPQSGVATI